MTNKLFYFSLVASFTVHALTLSGLSSMNARKLFVKPPKQIEVTYYALKPKQPQERKVEFRDLKITKESKITKDVKVLSKKLDNFPNIVKNIRDISKLTGKFKLDKKHAPKISTKDMDRRISIPLLKSEKITNPNYLSYNQTMRQRIKQRAYSYVDDPNFQAGGVYVTFLLASNGTLKQIKIIEGKTEANEHLRSVALRSIKESSPFPPFPAGFDYQEFTFNLLISFKE